MQLDYFIYYYYYRTFHLVCKYCLTTTLMNRDVGSSNRVARPMTLRCYVFNKGFLANHWRDIHDCCCKWLFLRNVPVSVNIGTVFQTTHLLLSHGNTVYMQCNIILLALTLLNIFNHECGYRNYVSINHLSTYYLAMVILYTVNAI